MSPTALKGGGLISQSIIDGLVNYFGECPLLSGIPPDSRFIDWTSDTAVSYGIIIDSDIEIKKFISGGGKREYNFTLQIRLNAENKMSAENPEWMEQMKKWCADQSSGKNFPDMPDGCIPTKISAERGVLYERDRTGKTGLYKIRFKLKYIKS